MNRERWTKQAEQDAGAGGDNAEGHGDASGNADVHGSNGDDPMDVDGSNASKDQDVSSQRIEAFEAILGQHVLANHVDQMSIDEVEQAVNRDAAATYTRGQVEFILERMQDANRIMIRDGIVRII